MARSTSKPKNVLSHIPDEPDTSLSFFKVILDAMLESYLVSLGGIESALKRVKSPSAPAAEINYHVLNILSLIGLRDETKAAILGISTATFERWKKADGPNYDPKFAKAIEVGESYGKAAIASAQFISAVVERNQTQLIWQGKQRLGQRDDVPPTVVMVTDPNEIRERLNVAMNLPKHLGKREAEKAEKARQEEQK